MSDDDLWRPKEPADRPVEGDATGDANGDEAAPAPGEQPGEQPAAPVSDETQPITGAGPSYVPPPGPSAVPPPQNPYAPPPSQGAPPGPYPGPYPGQPSPYGQQQHNPYASGFPASGPPTGQPGQPGGPGFVPPANPYAAPHEFAQPQSPYGVPYQPAYAGGQLPDHPSATTAMVLGIIGLVGILFCGGLTLVLSPAAWVVGRKAVREIDSVPGRYAGRDKAQAGKIMGIIGSVLLALGVLAFIVFVTLAVIVSPSDSQQPPAPIFSNSGA